MDVKLATGGMNVFLLRLISRTWTAVRCMLKDPDAQKIGEYSEDRAFALKKLNAMLDEMIQDAGGGIGFRYSYEQVPRSYIAVG